MSADDTWPKGRSPGEIGAKAAKRFAVTPLRVPLAYDGAEVIPEYIAYYESCAWYAALLFARSTRDEALAKQLRGRFEPLLGSRAGLIPRLPARMMLHYGSFGAVPLALYQQTGDTRYLAIGTSIAEAQWARPSTDWLAAQPLEQASVVEQAVKAGLNSQPRFWISDEIYLSTIAQIQAFRATGNPTYLDRAAREIVVYLDKLQAPNGLFYHSANGRHFWGRGNGWAAAGMAELLEVLPSGHTDRSRVMVSYQKMMTALLEYQAGNGMWRQLLDDSDAWPETSGTGMFIFALWTGVKHGWLEVRAFKQAAREGWLGLTEYIDAEGKVAEVSEGSMPSSNPRYYLNRERHAGDLHGMVGVLCSAAVLAG